jgi:hypothetical protein
MRDINDPVWSVIILLCCGLAFTLYCVIYILLLSFKELEEDVQVTKQRQEGHCEQQEAESGQCNGQEG